MAGDWIKFEVTTPEKEEIYQIAAELEITADEVIGKLMRVWIWFDQHTENGNASVTVQALLDSKAGVTGFCKAMQSVGWMEINGQRLTLPHYEYHNGKTAKNRAVTNRRVAKSREKKRSRNDDCNDDTVTNIVTREEKRREEVVPPNPQRGDGDGDKDQDVWAGIFPSGSLQKRATDQKRIRITKNLPVMQEIGKWFRRSPETLWTVYEARALKQLWPISEDEYRKLRSYYMAEITEQNDIRRKNLEALLNNWSGEVDRAEGYLAKNKPKVNGQTPDPEKLQSRHNPRCWLYKSEWPIVQAHIDRHKNDMHPKTYELAKMEFAKMPPQIQDDIAEIAYQHRTGLEMKLP